MGGEMESPTGKISLVFRRKENGNTYLAKQFFKLPLQIMTPYYHDDDGTVFLYLLNPSGGILQHDRLLTEILVEEQGKALITTPSNTKLYKMDEGYAHLVNTLTLKEGAVLEYLPEHNVPFADSNTLQENNYYLKQSSILIASDMVTAGRVSRGEVFQYSRFQSKTKIFVDGKLEAFDCCNIHPKETELHRIGLMESYLSNGTFYIYKKNMGDKLLNKINSFKNEFKRVHFGASNVTNSLMIVRFLGESIIDMQDTMQKIWDLARRELLGKASVRIRKY